jgi:UDP-N-acetylglucosamine/UDP-N-acetylgalactosamine diphosphorylase
MTRQEWNFIVKTPYEQTEELLAKYRQTHLLHFYSQLSEASREKLLDQIRGLDWEQLEAIMKQGPDQPGAFDDIKPISALDLESFSREERLKFEDCGFQLLREGKVGAVVVAGGQGSRLGHDGPKGTFDIGLPSHKSLFQLQAERLLNLTRRAGRSIPWYIMTSPDNHEETVRFFTEAGFFGYKREDCVFFRQGVMPAVDAEGRILLASKDEISLAPSGNGDCFDALNRSGALADMKRRGVDWLFYYNVDNVLIKVADPVFVGVAAHFNRPIATKVLDKAHPDEKVGIICARGGRPAVVEYSDLPQALMNQRDREGRLTFGLGYISINLIRRDFIEQHAASSVPYHTAHKQINHINSEGEMIVPQSPNGYKLERFIFDYFSLSEGITVLKTIRDSEFAPVKNKEGEDSPQTARELLYKLHRSWLLQAGGSAAQLEEEVEISPLVSYSGEGL